MPTPTSRTSSDKERESLDMLKDFDLTAMQKTVVKEIEKIWLSNAEAQRYLGMSAGFFKHLRENGTLPYYKLGQSVFYRKADIDRLLERNNVVN